VKESGQNAQREVDKCVGVGGGEGFSLTNPHSGFSAVQDMFFLLKGGRGVTCFGTLPTPRIQRRHRKWRTCHGEKGAAIQGVVDRFSVLQGRGYSERSEIEGIAILFLIWVWLNLRLGLHSCRRLLVGHGHAAAAAYTYSSTGTVHGGPAVAAQDGPPALSDRWVMKGGGE